MDSLKLRLESLRSELFPVKPESAGLIKEAMQALDDKDYFIANQAVTIGTLQNQLGVAHGTLDRYADPVFWLRLPPSTFATADKGQMARDCLRQISEEHDV